MFKLHRLLKNQPSNIPDDNMVGASVDTGAATSDRIARQGLFVIGAARTGTTILQIRKRERDPCFAAFHQNKWWGLAVWIGIVLALAVR